MRNQALNDSEMEIIIDQPCFLLGWTSNFGKSIGPDHPRRQSTITCSSLSLVSLDIKDCDETLQIPASVEWSDMAGLLEML